MRRTVWLTSFVVWSIVGVFNIAPTVVANLSAGRPFPKLFVALITESVWVWAAYTPLILWLCMRQPLRARAIAIHAGCAIALALIDPLIDTPFVWFVEPRPESYTQRLLEELFINVFSYAAVAGVGYALVYRRGLAEQRAQLLQARLDALASRLQPHFLFNALHSVTALIRSDDRTAAIRAIVALGDLLRGTLADGGATVELARELAWIRQYLEIEQMRFQDRLSVEVAVEPGLDAALVPALVLQPLVENAVRHGVEARVGASRLTVAARRDGNALVLEVVDAGDPAAARTERDGNGVGLRTTRERIAHLFGSDGRFDLEVTPGQSRATIAIPYRTEAA